MRIIINIVLVMVIIFSFQNCKNKQEKENENKYNLSYRVDTLKIVNKRYIHECGLGLEWYSIIAPYPVFTSDSTPDIIKEFNKNITENIEANVKKMLQSHYKFQLENNAFISRFKNGTKSYTEGTIEERIEYFMKTTIVDTLMFKYESNVYTSKNYISIGIEGINTLGFTGINIAPEDNPLCFNILFNENRKLDPKECFNYKEGKIDAWKEFFAYNSRNPNLNKPYIFDKNQSEFFPIDFYQYSEDMICLYFSFSYDYGNSVFGCFMLKDLEQYFDINYLNEIKKEKK